MPNTLTYISNMISKKMKKKLETAYEKASPKVKKEIQKFVESKMVDTVAIASKVARIIIISAFVFKAVNYPSGAESTAEDIARVINTYYNRVNITYNYYSKGE